jgi:hypothetical protein
MNPESHERARALLRTARIEGISSGESQWLDAHLEGCVECSIEARSLAAAMDSLRALSVTAPVDVVRRTSLAVHRLAEQRSRKQEPAAFLCVAAAMASVWAILTTPFTWAAFAWLGHLFQVSDVIWQMGFLIWWFLPGTVLAAVLAWQHNARRDTDSAWATEPNWR